MQVNKGRTRLIKVLVTCSLLMASIPQAVQFGEAYAAGTSASTTVSVTDLQQKLLNAMTSRSEQLNFTYKGPVVGLKEKLQRAIAQAMESDPYINYTIKSYAFSYKGTSTSANVSVTLRYRETKAETAYVDQIVHSVLKQIVKPGMSSDEKVKAIHDWIVAHLKYDTTLQKYTAYDGLKTGSTVCQGYSLLAYKMLKQAGIPNRIVEGRAGGQLHAWNLVQLNGVWYHLDTTWDDPVPDQGKQISRNYYLLTDAEIRRDHSWTKSYPHAVTPYRQTLAGLIASDKAKASIYKKMYDELDYRLYDASEIVSTSAKLKTKAQAAMADGQSSMVIRFRGSQSQLAARLQDLYQLGLHSISYHVIPFKNTSDLRVSIKWT
ncbi:transglutaminase domain-containing protein [Paenibacillus sp. JX-17]|uniref:Transglutaminase domain-containing protein n=1 Tax=Paenibacillus lacisoli TaxID=3064525 RepID=A0ABT9CJS4_9BACL|nr:transglutaminase domain-containing protein [Paenibacillus sp. JX-17]MDO7907858.1 transglutaminase domain-containing protein [Paenibacillus sp. JX-17]